MSDSNTYAALIAAGPFPGRVDSWAQAEPYFHPLQSALLSALMTQFHDQNVLCFGYTPRLAASEQNIAAVSAIYVDCIGKPHPSIIIEVLSPTLQADSNLSASYHQRREEWRAQGTMLIEIDLTRLPNYHTAIYSGDSTPITTSIPFGDPLPTIAFPLSPVTVKLDVQAAYNRAYQQAKTAEHIENDTHYDESCLPHPSSLTDSQRRDALAAVEAWHNQLVRLRENAAP